MILAYFWNVLYIEVKKVDDFGLFGILNELGMLHKEKF